MWVVGGLRQWKGRAGGVEGGQVGRDSRLYIGGSNASGEANQ